MFTGLIEATAAVLALDKGQLQLERPADFTDIKIGSSIAVSGVCLTVTKLDQKTMQFQMVDETLNRSKLGSLKTGDRVNLERAMKDDGRLEGHKVQGHVEGVGIVSEMITKKDGAILIVDLPSNLVSYVIPKGSITLDGVSLTIANIEGNRITVALIPHTLAHTTLGTLRAGDHLNIETDMMVRAFAQFSRPNIA